MAKTIQLLDEPTLSKECVVYLQRAADSGSTHAAYLIWKDKYCGEVGTIFIWTCFTFSKGMPFFKASSFLGFLPIVLIYFISSLN